MADSTDPNVFTQTVVRHVDARNVCLSIQQSMRADGTWFMNPVLFMQVSDGTQATVTVNTDAFLTADESAAAQSLFAKIIGSGIIQAGFSQ